MQGSIISDNKDLLTGNYLTSEESSLNILDPPSLYVENNYVELLNIYPEDVSVHYALNKTPTRDDSVLDKSTLLPSNGNYYFKAFGEGKESTSSICKINNLSLTPIDLKGDNSDPWYGGSWHGAYGNGVYVWGLTVNDYNNNFLYYSYDGLEYLPCNKNFSPEETHNLSFCKNIFLCSYAKTLNGSEYKAYSQNGIDWYNINSIEQGTCAGFATNGEIIITLSRYGNYYYVYTSNDGINWVKQENYIKPESSNSLWNLCYGKGLFVVCSSENCFYSSTDGINWGKQKETYTDWPVDLLYNSNKFIGRLGSNIVYSYNGINWSFSNPIINIPQKITAISNFYCCSEEGYSDPEASISYDGIHWEKFIYDGETSNILIINDKFYFKGDTSSYYCQL